MAGRSQESLQRELKIQYRNLDELKERQAKFGINAPLDLINQIYDIQAEIDRLEQMLDDAQHIDETAAGGVATIGVEQGIALQTLDERDWDSLLRRIKDGNCTPLIGPELYQGCIPSDKDIAQTWATEHGYPLADSHNLPRVAQFLATSRDPIFPAEDMAKRLREIQTRPNFKEESEPHTFLAGLPLPLYITTNYDNFMYQALRHRLRPATQQLCRWNKHVRDMPSVFDPGSPIEVSPTNPVVYHLFGYAEVPESMVLTEDDYLDFLINISKEPGLIPIRIQKALVKTSLLFIGFELSQLRFRVLFRGLVASLERSLRRTRVAVQLAPEPANVEGITSAHVRWYFEDYMARDDVRVYWGTSFDFIKELKERWEAFNERA